MSSGFLGGGIGPTAIKRRSGLAAPVPVAGTELLTDTSLEAAYVAGLCSTLLVSGTPTVAESADARTGSKAQQFIGNNDTQQRIRIPLPSMADGTWYRCGVYAKRTIGIAGDVRIKSYNGAFDLPGRTIDSAAYALYELTHRKAGSSDFKLCEKFSGVGGNSDTIVVDDMSTVALTLSSLFSTRIYASADCDLSAAVTRTAGTQAGLVARLDSATSPANFVIAYLDGGVNVKVDKCVAGTYTNVISGAVTYAAGRVLRLVCNGNDVSAYYNGTQVGSTVTVSDAGIVSNTRHGLFSTYASNTFSGYVAA